VKAQNTFGAADAITGDTEAETDAGSGFPYVVVVLRERLGTATLTCRRLLRRLRGRWGSRTVRVTLMVDPATAAQLDARLRAAAQSFGWTDAHPRYAALVAEHETGFVEAAYRVAGRARASEGLFERARSEPKLPLTIRLRRDFLSELREAALKAGRKCGRADADVQTTAAAMLEATWWQAWATQPIRPQD
jgi:hypothetical protein